MKRLSSPPPLPPTHLRPTLVNPILANPFLANPCWANPFSCVVLWLVLVFVVVVRVVFVVVCCCGCGSCWWCGCWFGPPSAGQPKFSPVFSLSRPHIRSLSLSLCVFSLNLGGFSEDQDPQLCASGVLWLSGVSHNNLRTPNIGTHPDPNGLAKNGFGQNWSNQKGQNGTGQSRSLPLRRGKGKFQGRGGPAEGRGSGGGVGPRKPPGLHTTAREPGRAHFRPRPLQTSPKFGERTPKKEKKERKLGRESEKRKRNFGRSVGGGVQPNLGAPTKILNTTPPTHNTTQHTKTGLAFDTC